jgi:hypothetical protein
VAARPTPGNLDVSRRPGTRRWTRWVATVVLAATVPVVQPPAAVAAPGGPALVVQTMPTVADAPVSFDGHKLRTGRDGTLRIVPGDWTNLRRRMHVSTVWRDGKRVRFSRWIGQIDQSAPPSRDIEVAAAFDVDYPVQFRFVDPDGRRVPYGSISEVELRSATGAVVNVTGPRLRRPLLLWGARVVTLHAGLQLKDIYYRLQSVHMRGANVVNQSQQRYIPSDGRSVDVELLFYDAKVVVQDALFGFPVGAAVQVRYPDGSHERHPLEAGRTVTIRSLPRGQYDLTVEGLGLPISSPVAVTRDQTIPLKFVTWLDAAVGLLAVLTFLVGLPLLGRRMLRRPKPAGDRDANHGWFDPLPRRGP